MEKLNLESLTPKEITTFLNKYIIKQEQAKKSIAIALRNRWRRQRVATAIKDEITPKNILMIGPTGVGKTEIARRIAKLINAPFIKVEASKFTEIGYVGRDVESIIRDLAEISFNLVKKEKIEKVQEEAKEQAVFRVVEYLLPNIDEQENNKKESTEQATADAKNKESARNKLKEKFYQKVKKGQLNDYQIEIQVSETPQIAAIEFTQLSGGDFNQLQDTLSNLLPKKRSKKKIKVKDALHHFQQEEAEKLITKDDLNQQAIERLEQTGIVFIDEIDKVISKDEHYKGDISGEGVQRDLLPIVEGSTVKTKYGTVNTDYILFIAAGAFHFAKPSEMIPEFQGRFPIRVELDSLSQGDLVRILTEPSNSLIKQYIALLKTENIQLEFAKDAIERLASIAFQVNESTINIGARRLHTIAEKLLEEINFDAPSMSGNKVKITVAYVNKQLQNIYQDEDLNRYIL